MKELEIIRLIAQQERKHIIDKYQGNIAGKCIEASDELYAIYNARGFNVKSKQVFVLYENFENCMDTCYEEHWLDYILLHGLRVYIDVTMDQFQWAFSRKLPEVYIDWKLPNFYLSKEPGKVTLEKCGWTEWYNYGNYVNNFDYWR